MTEADDIRVCAEAIRHGSRSFHAASHLLPRSVREPAMALYAFCRLADDAVDLQRDKASAVLRLADRLECVYDGRPVDAAADRAFASVVERFDMPRVLPEGLLEGLAWDAEGRRYETLSDLRAYSARVASAVGLMMCVLMRVRDRDALARAADLGVAMQLTNIARDVGEDARENRLYLPTNWLAEVGLDPEAFLARPAMSNPLAALIERLLKEADALYVRSESGIGVLPFACRPGIFAARHIYAGIGGRLRGLRHDSVDHRATTSGSQKLGWLMLSAVRAATSAVMPVSPVLHARVLPETVFLVDAAAQQTTPRANDWSETMISTLAGLKARDLDRRAIQVKTPV